MAGSNPSPAPSGGGSEQMKATDQVKVTYHGPSGTLIDGDTTFVQGGEPVTISRGQLSNLRNVHPDHIFKEHRGA